jgi:hypothetical protein
VAFHPADFKSMKNTQSIIPRELAHPIPIFRKILAREKNTGSAGQNPVFMKNQAKF